MKYTTVPTQGGYIIREKGDDGLPVGPTLAEVATFKDAKAKIREFRASEGTKATLFTQAQTNYVTVSGQLTAGKACANCRFFTGDSYWRPCAIVENYPDQIMATGLCNKHELNPPFTPEPMPVYIVGERGLSNDPNVLQRGFKALMELFGFTGSKGEVEVGFKVLPTGEWFGLYSNNFIDRQNEAFSSKGIDEFVYKVKSGEYPYPDLMFWHLKGTEVQGKATDVGRAGNFIWAKGTFSDDEVGQKFKAYYEKNGPWKMSHGFYYNPLKKSADGVYHEFRTFEVTVLPPHAAANPYTSFNGGLKMAEVTKEQKDHLVAALGPELGAQFANLATQAGKGLEESVGAKSAQPVPEDVTQAAKTLQLLAESQETLTKGLNVVTQSLLPVLDAQKAMLDRQSALEKKFDEFIGLTPNPSKSEKTVVEPTPGSEAEFLKTKNNLQGQKSVLEMMLEGHIDLSQAQPVTATDGQ